MKLKLYEVRHEGHWLGGVSLAFARDEAEAVAMVNAIIPSHGCKTTHTKVKRELYADAPCAFVLDNGDY